MSFDRRTNRVSKGALSLSLARDSLALSLRSNSYSSSPSSFDWFVSAQTGWGVARHTSLYSPPHKYTHTQTGERTPENREDRRKRRRRGLHPRAWLAECSYLAPRNGEVSKAGHARVHNSGSGGGEEISSPLSFFIGFTQRIKDARRNIRQLYTARPLSPRRRGRRDMFVKRNKKKKRNVEKERAKKEGAERRLLRFESRLSARYSSHARCFQFQRWNTACRCALCGCGDKKKEKRRKVERYM